MIISAIPGSSGANSVTSGGRVDCGRCRMPLPIEVLNRGGAAPCPHCATPTIVVACPALLRPMAPGRLGDSVEIDGEAGCFFHADRRAELACEVCGRFLCALCHMALDGCDLCPTCLETERNAMPETGPVGERTCYDRMALSLALLPMLFGPVTLVTAPATMVLVIKCWRKPRSVFGFVRLRFLLAFAFAVLQFAFWMVVFAGIVWTRKAVTHGA